MKKRSTAFIILIIGILLIVLGICILIFKKINIEKNKQKELEKNIIENYNIFENKVSAFDENRSLYYTNTYNNLILENVKTNYKNWILVLDNYTDKVDQVEEASVYLKQNCIEKEYSNQDISNKCKSFIIRYETVINYYAKDIISFNKVLSEYRKEFNVIEENSEIKDYYLKYNYVDINLDGEFKGKN